MSPEKEALIAAVAERLAKARIRLDCVSAMNATDSESRIKAQIEHSLATAERNEALADLNRVTSADFQPTTPKEGT